MDYLQKFNFKNFKNGLLWLVFCAVILGLFSFNSKTPQTTFHHYETGFLEILDAEGHAIEKHVAKSDAYLRHRLLTEDISAASTFNSMAEAEQAIATVLQNREKLIASWIKSGKSNRKAFYWRVDRPVGKVLKREWPKPQSGNQVRVVLLRDETYPQDFKILTAYPEIR